MWYFSSNEEEKVLYITPACREIVVGRSNDPSVCDFSIVGEASISRRHALFSLCGNLLMLKDLGSRYGTFIINSDNPTAPSTQEKVILKELDVVRFGFQESLWTLQKVNFVTCTSTIKRENLQMLKASLDNLGGTLKNDWDDDCSFLTMPAITLTVKVVLALVQGSFIVSPDFWSKCCEAVSTQTKLPDPALYTPSVIEPTLNKENVSFLPDDKRKNIFQGKTFMFFSRRQMDMYQAVLLKGGATVLLLTESKYSKSMLIGKEIILIQYPVNNVTQETQAQKNQINDIVNYLKSKGRRVVPDSEIGLAIVYGSLEKHCNPEFSFFTEIMKNNDVESSSSSQSLNVLAKETQDIGMGRVEDQKIIDESVTDMSEGARDVILTESSSKRKLSDESIITGENLSAKRRAIEKVTEVNADSQELFNFIQEESNRPNLEKRLNFTKPQKRKTHLNEDDDDLFDFVPEQNEQTKELDTTLKSNIKRPRLDKDQHKNTDFTPVRGIKVKDLLENNISTWKSRDDLKKIKKEETDDDDLNDKMNGLEMGTSIIKIRDDLVKTERKSLVVEPVIENVKNFKKFKKVWPVNMEVTTGLTSFQTTSLVY